MILTSLGQTEHNVASDIVWTMDLALEQIKTMYYLNVRAVCKILVLSKIDVLILIHTKQNRGSVGTYASHSNATTVKNYSLS
jgi:hypothetical protein